MTPDDAFRQHADRRGRALRAAVAVLVLAVFVAVRAWGIDFGQPPRMAHPDERYAVIAERMTWSDLNPHYFLNPPLMSYALFGAKELTALVRGDDATGDWIAGGGLRRLARWLSVVTGALTALLVGGAARRLLAPLLPGGADRGDASAAIADDARRAPGDDTALHRDAGATGFGLAAAAAAVVGLSFLHGRDSHYGVNDVPMVFGVGAALYAACRGLDGGRGWLVASAAAAGVAAATKYNGALAVVLPCAAWVLRARGARHGATRAGWLGSAALGLVVVALVSGAAFVACNPYAVLAPGEFVDGVRRQLVDWGDREAFAQGETGAASYARAGLALLGSAHALAAIAGALWLLRRAPARSALLLLAPALYLAGMLDKELFYYRFALPLLPFAAACAAWTWWMLARLLAERARVPHAAALALLVALASAGPAAALLRHDWLASRDDTWIQAVDWIEARVPAGSRIFLEGAVPRIRFPDAYRVLLPPERGHAFERIVERGDDGVPRPAIAQGGWLVTDSYNAHLARHGDLQRRPQMRGTEAFLDRLAREHELVAEFAPGPRGDPEPFVIDARYSPLVDLWSIERPGFTVRVYRIEPGSWR